MPLKYKTHKNETTTPAAFIDYYGKSIVIAPGETKTFVIDNMNSGKDDLVIKQEQKI